LSQGPHQVMTPIMDIHYITLTRKGIGQATATMFAAEGCRKIVIADVNESGLQTAKQKIETDFQGVEVLDVIVGKRKELFFLIPTYLATKTYQRRNLSKI
jgi:NADP-dependent 3-hydroxy acid dehydrogenase YdfG